MTVSILSFDVRNTDSTLDELIEYHFGDKKEELYIPELNKSYTYDPDSIETLKDDVIEFYALIQGGEIEECEESAYVDFEKIDKLKEAARATDNRANIVTFLMGIGALISIGVGIYCFSEGDYVAGGSCLGTAIGTFLIIAFFASVSDSIVELHKKIKMLEKELTEIKKRTNEDCHI